MFTSSSKLWILALSTLGLSTVAMFFLPAILVQQSGGSSSPLSKAVSKDDHSIGNIQSNVTVVIYSDLQCPACAGANEFFGRIETDYKERVHFVHRHFPTPLHKNSLLAALAAEAAGKQGKFFDMRDAILRTQNEWAHKSKADAYQYFVGLSSRLGLSVKQFEVDFHSKQLLAQVFDDIKSGRDSSLQSVPSIFINGVLIPLTSEKDIRNKIDAAINGK